MTHNVDAHRRFASRAGRALLLLLVGLALLLPGAVAAGQPGPPPTVGEITVDNFDCETGDLAFHVTVGDVSHRPQGLAADFSPLIHGWMTTYSAGDDEYAGKYDVWSPPASAAPYSGRVDLATTVLPTNRTGATPGSGVVTSITITVAVGHPVFNGGALYAPTDSESVVFPADCDSDEPDLIEQLIAVLIRILQQIIGG